MPTVAAGRDHERAERGHPSARVMGCPVVRADRANHVVHGPLVVRPGRHRGLVAGERRGLAWVTACVSIVASFVPAGIDGGSLWRRGSVDHGGGAPSRRRARSGRPGRPARPASAGRAWRARSRRGARRSSATGTGARRSRGSWRRAPRARRPPARAPRARPCRHRSTPSGPAATVARRGSGAPGRPGAGASALRHPRRARRPGDRRPRRAARSDRPRQRPRSSSVHRAWKASPAGIGLVAQPASATAAVRPSSPSPTASSASTRRRSHSASTYDRRRAASQLASASRPSARRPNRTNTSAADSSMSRPQPGHPAAATSDRAGLRVADRGLLVDADPGQPEGRELVVDEPVVRVGLVLGRRQDRGDGRPPVGRRHRDLVLHQPGPVADAAVIARPGGEPLGLRRRPGAPRPAPGRRPGPRRGDSRRRSPRSGGRPATPRPRPGGTCRPRPAGSPRTRGPPRPSSARPGPRAGPARATPPATRRRATRSRRRPRPGSPPPRPRSGRRRRRCAGPAAADPAAPGSAIGPPAALHAAHRDHAPVGRPSLQPQQDPGLQRVRGDLQLGRLPGGPAARVRASGVPPRRARGRTRRSRHRGRRGPTSARSVVAPATLDHRSRAKRLVAQLGTERGRRLVDADSHARVVDVAGERDHPTGRRRTRSAGAAARGGSATRGRRRTTPAATRCSSAASMSVTSPPARSSSDVGDPALELAARRRGDPASRRRRGSGRGPAAWSRRRRSRAPARRDRRSRDRSVPPATRPGPRARARRRVGRGSRASRAATLASAPSPRVLAATTASTSRSPPWACASRSSQNGEPPARSHNAARRGRVDRRPRSRRVGRRRPGRAAGAAPWRRASPSPMTVASDATNRSVTVEGRDATTSANPRPEPAVARTRKWHRASESGSTHWRSSTNRVGGHAAAPAGDGPTRRSGWRRGRRPRRPDRAARGTSDPRWSPPAGGAAGTPRPAARSTRARSRRTGRPRPRRAPAPASSRSRDLPIPGSPTRSSAPTRRSRRLPATSVPIAATSSVRPTNTSPTRSGYAYAQWPPRPARANRWLLNGTSTRAALRR